MNPDIASGMIGGIAEATHQRNLLDLQNTVAGNQLMASHLLKLSDDPTMLPEAQQRALQGAMDIYSNLGKSQGTNIGKTLSDIAQIHVRQGSPGWLGGQTQQQIQAQNMPIAAELPQQAAPPPGLPLPPGMIGGITSRPQDIAPPGPPPGTAALSPALAAQAPATPAGAAYTPPPATFTTPLPAPPPGYTRPGRLTPLEQAQLQGQQLGIATTAQRRAQIQSMPELDQMLKNLYPGMSEQMRSFLALGVPLGSMMGTTPVQDVPGSLVNLSTDAFGNPINPSDNYTVLHDRMGNAVTAYPKNIRAPELKYGQLEGTNEWVAIAQSQYVDPATGLPKLSIMQHLGFTPPAGIPTYNMLGTVRQVPRADGGIDLVPITEPRVTQKGTPSAAPGVAAPVPAPNPPDTGTAAPTGQQQTQQQPSQAKGIPQATIGTPVHVGERPLAPQQVITDEQKGSALLNTAQRLTTVLDFANNPKNNFNSVLQRAKLTLETDPQTGVIGLVAKNTVGLTPAESKFIAAYTALGEDIMILRSAFGANISRGEQTMNILLNQRGDLKGNPDVFKNLLMNTADAVAGQLSPLQKGLTRAGQPLDVNKVIGLYRVLGGGDKDVIKTLMRQDGWIK